MLLRLLASLLIASSSAQESGLLPLAMERVSEIRALSEEHPAKVHQWILRENYGALKKLPSSSHLASIPYEASLGSDDQLRVWPLGTWLMLSVEKKTPQLELLKTLLNAGASAAEPAFTFEGSGVVFASYLLPLLADLSSDYTVFPRPFDSQQSLLSMQEILRSNRSIVDLTAPPSRTALGYALTARQKGNEREFMVEKISLLLSYGASVNHRFRTRDPVSGRSTSLSYIDFVEAQTKKNFERQNRVTAQTATMGKGFDLSNTGVAFGGGRRGTRQSKSGVTYTIGVPKHSEAVKQLLRERMKQELRSSGQADD